jgi:hypothetical protein
LYKGRRRSHRFSILGDTAFEYDCILEREPDSSVISLLMHGAENFDFFRQPDFLTDPLLAGSYAVYKKETLIGEGTGKLCHIHRPEIIDARGRRCWGDLAVTGNELHIIIPEDWLSEAKYPVIVDPSVGTTAAGSQTTGPDPDNSRYDRPMLDGQMALNKYPVSQDGSGTCTAYIYTYFDEAEFNAIPCLYLDNSSKPYYRKSANAKLVDVHVSSSLPSGWRSNTFTLNGSIEAGDYVWFGVFASWFTTRFDYGGECYKFWPNWSGEGNPPLYLQIGPNDSFCNIKWSWYFTYGPNISQNYVCALTQGVPLADNLTMRETHKRNLSQTAGVISFSSAMKTLYRRCITAAGSIAETTRKAGYSRQQTETVKAEEALRKGLLLFARIATGVFVRDFILSRFLKARQELAIKSCVSREAIIDSRID